MSNKCPLPTFPTFQQNRIGAYERHIRSPPQGSRQLGVEVLHALKFESPQTHRLAARPAGFIEPCLPTLARTVPEGDRWAFEIKHDGFRFVARRDGRRVRVFSRHGKDWTDKVPAIVAAMRVLPVTSATLDG
jgi:ATP-dependent DNA ligase